ncbi:uncharacterized protein LOC133176354 [Saccostrea echinata]|uniref:uncharacterized protein LOC133176354 n=1 Tax=Saccostrea echinata TaxID=191078 RepID=UPI002A826C08|nr:uncharacterized protein LOC133176354 [Saccostrea echinata]
MDGILSFENDYFILEKLIENGIDKSAMEGWLNPETFRKVDLFAAVKESVWKKSIYHHSSHVDCDCILFAHTQNHTIVEEVLQYFKRVLLRYEPKIEIYQRHLWTPINDSCGSLQFKTGSQKTVSAAMGFLLVTSEFCADEWPILAGQPFFQEAMYSKNVTIVPILIHNPKKAKYKIPMGIKSLRSIEFFSKDDILCQDSVINILQPVVKKRLRNEKEKLKDNIKWLYENIICKLALRNGNGDSWFWRFSSPGQKNPDSKYTNNDSFHYANQPYNNFHSSNAKKNGSTHHGSVPDSAYASNESNDDLKSSPLHGFHHSELCRNTSRSPVEHSLPNTREEIKSRTTQGHSSRECNVGWSRSESSKSDSSSSPISMKGAPDLNFSSLESRVSESSKHRRPNRSENSPKYSSTIKTTQDSSSYASQQNITGIQVQSSPRNKPNTVGNNINGKVTANQNSTDKHESTKPELNISINKKVPYDLPVAIEVECRSFGNLSTQDVRSTPQSRAQDSSSVHESNLSNHSVNSSSIRQNSEIIFAKTSDPNKDLPNPVPINANNISWNISTNLSSNHSPRSANERSGTSSSSGIFDHNQGHIHPQPQPINSFPSGEVHFSTNSYTSAVSGEINCESSRNSFLSSSNISSCETSSLRRTMQQPMPQEISLTSFPAEGELSNDLNSKASFTPVSDVTQLALGCLRPSDSFKDSYRSFVHSEPDSGRPVGVVRPFSMQEENDEDENEYSNDLSLFRAMSEETYVKRS